MFGYASLFIDMQEMAVELQLGFRNGFGQYLHRLASFLGRRSSGTTASMLIFTHAVIPGTRIPHKKSPELSGASASFID